MTDFFRINMPYGMLRNDAGEWMFFNSEYTALGSKSRDRVPEDSDFFFPYIAIPAFFLLQLPLFSSHLLQLGVIVRICFYCYLPSPALITIDDYKFTVYTAKLQQLCAFL